MIGTLEPGSRVAGQAVCARCGCGIDPVGRATFKGGVGQPCPLCGGRRRKVSSATRHLVRYKKGDPRALEAGRRGGLAKSRNRSASRRALVSVLAERVIERADLILGVYFDVLALEPDPSSTRKEVQRLRLFQMEVAEMVLNRIDGLPPATNQGRKGAGQSVKPNRVPGWGPGSSDLSHTA